MTDPAVEKVTFRTGEGTRQAVRQKKNSLRPGRVGHNAGVVAIETKSGPPSAGNAALKIRGMTRIEHEILGLTFSSGSSGFVSKPRYVGLDEWTERISLEFHRCYVTKPSRKLKITF